MAKKLSKHKKSTPRKKLQQKAAKPVAVQKKKNKIQPKVKTAVKVKAKKTLSPALKGKATAKAVIKPSGPAKKTIRPLPGKEIVKTVKNKPVDKAKAAKLTKENGSLPSDKNIPKNGQKIGKKDKATTTPVAPKVQLKKPSREGKKGEPVIKKQVIFIQKLPVIENPLRSLPEPKGKFQLEYVVHAPVSILFEFLTSPSGLSEWFADDINIRNNVYTFFWEGVQQEARVINLKDLKLIRFQWVEKMDGSFFEFKIEKDELTGDLSLIVTDFADEEADFQTSKRLWDSQINKLLKVIGSH